ncbi:hypothetical protein Mal64_24840 [Pseudobythopirellula maris]|uniref:Uncharacterized protein n=1 Tax=Pseudobythopirellula maris TaxID=2527991 RepID=A0A5C5ZRY8_9BACT|nr:hypothetical protein [Pseudobythopirellula maris]TWT88993.1 hypothetical protein Mal64_24840 [Pseudobythopirellula maris]
MSVFALWLPILLAGLATHVASFLAWVVLPHHKPEWKEFPHEDELQDWLAERNAPPDQYLLPMCSEMSETKTSEYAAKLDKPHGMLLLWGHKPNIGKNIGMTLAYFLVASFCLGYLATLALAPGEGFFPVFRFVTTAGIMTYCFAKIPGVIWFRQKVLMDLVDGAAYAVIAGVIFAALWPAAA